MHNQYTDLRSYTDAFKALSDKTRLRIFYILCKLNKQLAVCEIMDSVNESQYNVSRHLKALKYAGLIQENKSGRWVFYSINHDDEVILPELIKVIRGLSSAGFKNDIKRAKERLQKRQKGRIIYCLNKCIPGGEK